LRSTRRSPTFESLWSPGTRSKFRSSPRLHSARGKGNAVHPVGTGALSDLFPAATCRAAVRDSIHLLRQKYEPVPSGWSVSSRWRTRLRHRDSSRLLVDYTHHRALSFTRHALRCRSLRAHFVSRRPEPATMWISSGNRSAPDAWLILSPFLGGGEVSIFSISAKRLMASRMT